MCLTAISSHCLAALFVKISAFNSKQPHAAKRLSLLRNEDQQQKNPLRSSATQWSISELQAQYCNDTRTVNLAFVQCVSYRQINCHCKN